MQNEQTSKITEKAEKTTLRLVLLLLLFAAVLGVLLLLTNEIIFEKENNFDTAVFKLFNFARFPKVRSLMLFFTFFGSSNFLLPAYLLLGGFYFFGKRNQWQSLNISAIGISSAALLFYLKSVFKRTRPAEQLLKHIAGYSYPSGHSFSSFTFSGILIYLVWQSSLANRYKCIWTVFLSAFAAMVALSRVYFRVHYPSDVLAGFLLSIVWLMISYFVLIEWNIAEKIHRALKRKMT